MGPVGEEHRDMISESPKFPECEMNSALPNPLVTFVLFLVSILCASGFIFGLPEKYLWTLFQQGLSMKVFLPNLILIN